MNNTYLRARQVIIYIINCCAVHSGGIRHKGVITIVQSRGQLQNVRPLRNKQRQIRHRDS